MTPDAESLAVHAVSPVCHLAPFSVHTLTYLLRPTYLLKFRAKSANRIQYKHNRKSAKPPISKPAAGLPHRSSRRPSVAGAETVT